MGRHIVLETETTKDHSGYKVAGVEKKSHLQRKHYLGQPHRDDSELTNPGHFLSVCEGRQRLSYFFSPG